MGPNLGSLQGRKSTRRMPSHKILNIFYELPEELFTKHGNITMAVDIIYWDSTYDDNLKGNRFQNCGAHKRQKSDNNCYSPQTSN